MILKQLMEPSLPGHRAMWTVSQRVKGRRPAQVSFPVPTGWGCSSARRRGNHGDLVHSLSESEANEHIFLPVSTIKASATLMNDSLCVLSHASDWEILDVSTCLCPQFIAECLTYNKCSTNDGGLNTWMFQATTKLKLCSF